MKNFFTFIFVFTTLIAYCGPAKTTTSVANGSWCTAAKWDNGIPNETKDEIIIDGDSINATCITNLVIGSTATLTIKNCGILVVQNIQFNNGCKIQIDVCCKLIVLGDLTNNNNSIDVVINGTLTATGTLNNGNGADISGNGTISAGTYTGSCCIMGFDPITIPPGTIIVDSVIGGAMPVELLYFEVIQNNDNENVLSLEWCTLSEVNNEYFIIEKSIDLKEWIQVTTVKADNHNGNIKMTYNITDTYIPGYTYYRLLQKDYDGNTELLSIKSIRYVVPKPSITIYPNPAKINQVIIICCKVFENDEEIYVTTIDGRQPSYRRYDNNLIFETAGIYFIKIGEQIFKIIIQ